MKKLQTILVLTALLLLPVSARAASDTVTLGGGAVSVLLPGNGLTYTIDSTTKVSSFTVTTNSITFEVGNGSRVLLTSPDRSSFTLSGDVDCSITQITCGTTESTVAISCASVNDSTHGLVVTPGATCSMATTGGGNTGSVGGSGGGAPSAAPISQPTPRTPAPNQTLPSGSVVIPAQPVPAPTPKPALPAFQFKRNLALNTKGSDVIQLQLRLQKLGYFPLNIKANGVFGPTTNASLKKFQAKYKIKENGFGTKTRTRLNSIK